MCSNQVNCIVHFHISFSIIETNLTFTEATKHAVSNEGCRLLLIENLPPGLYSDPFQVESQESFGGPKVSSCSIQPQNGSAKYRQSASQNDCLTLTIQVRELELIKVKDTGFFLSK